MLCVCFPRNCGAVSRTFCLSQQIPIIDDGEWSDRDEAEGEEDELEEDEEEEEESQANKKNKAEEPGNEGETQVAKPDSSPPPSIKQ